MHDLIADVFSVALAALGISYLVQARLWAELYREFGERPDTLMPTGLLLMVAGLFVAVGFDDWTETWTIFITVFGWLMAIEGCLLVIKPQLLAGFTRRLGDRLVVFFRLGGALVVGLGGWLVWRYLLESML